MIRKIAAFVTDNLVWLVVGAGVAGYLLAPVADALAPATAWVLAVMVAGSGLTLPLRRVFAVRGTLGLTVCVLVLQLGGLPFVGYGLAHVVPNAALGLGLLALGVAPSEITSALMTLLAGGDLALATRLMAISVFLSAFLTPLWLALFLGQSVPLDLGGVAVELGLIIALPFLVASGLRARFARLGEYEAEWGAVSALAVVVLIFIVGGSIARYAVSLDLLWVVLACLGFNLCGYALGWAISRATRQGGPQTRALVFSSGMREFGIATAVALDFLPSGAALAPALYGVIMMLTASALAGRLRTR